MNTKTTILKNRLRTAAILIVSAMLFASCGDSNVDMIKKGTMESHPQGTIGNVFEANFDNAHWSSEETGGKVYVKFTGEISEELHNKAISNKREVETLCALSNDALYREAEANLSNDYETNVRPHINAFDNYIKSNNRNYLNYEDNYNGGSSEEQKQLKEWALKYNLEKKRLEEVKFKQARAYELREHAELKRLKENFPNTLWEVNSPVEFSWVVYPNSEQFELKEFSNSSWAKRRTSLQEVFNKLYQ